MWHESNNLKVVGEILTCVYCDRSLHVEKYVHFCFLVTGRYHSGVLL